MKILFIERSPTSTVSIEKVFRNVSEELEKRGFEIEFQQMPFGNDLIGILKNLLFFKPRTADVYHITGHIHYIALRLPIGKTLLTIHDLRILLDRIGLKRLIIKKLFFDFPIRRMKHISAISQATKKSIIENTNCDSEKISVIENPVSRQSAVLERKPFNEKCPTILQIGTAFHKNIPNLVTAIDGLNCKLKIIGNIDENLASILKNVNFENAMNLSESEMANEYLNADIVSFCSVFEGFGLPIVEAQVFGKPVVTSNLSPMKEVAGDGASLVDPENSVEIRKAIDRIISNEKYRNSLIENGFENVKRFEPSKIALQYLEIYKRISNTNKNTSEK